MKGFAPSPEYRHPAGSRRVVQLGVAGFLTWIAGFVDAVGFLTFASIYTANMSGNSVALGISLAQHRWPMVLFRFWPILFYIFGLVFGRTLIEVGARQRTRHIACVAFGCEVLLLGIVSFFDPNARYESMGWQRLAIALLATAMGIQNSTLTRFSSLTLHTGFVTGTLVEFAEQFVAYGTFLWDTLRNGTPFVEAFATSADQKSFRLALVLALTWMAYVFGAALGAVGKRITQSQALVVPVIGLVLLIAIDLYQPLAIQEERQQLHFE